MVAERSHVVWFGDIGRADVALVGGKSASLGEMIRSLAPKGIRVPPGFATTSDAYWRFLDENNLRPRMAALLADFAAGRLSLDWLAVENARRAVPDRILAATAVIKACALCLQQIPELNGHFAENRFSQIAEIKMGIGIALRGGGLIAPALPSPDTMSLGEIMERLRDLAARVRGGRLRSSELTGATVTLSSLGDDSADMVLPVIYPPQVAIIGVGQVVERPHVVDGAIAVRKVATFALAGDHRANDGRAAARFLNRLGKVLQKPEDL